jgi:RNA polymerase sigma-70 factor (family 1)
MGFTDQQLVREIKRGNLTSFETLYKEYYAFLCLLAEHIVRNSSDAEEIVSDVFIKLWKIREKLNITTSIKAYLVRAVYNTSVNYLERSKTSNVRTKKLNASDLTLLAWDSDYPIGQLFEKEITEILEQGIDKLPTACRQVFLLSRDEDMKYSDIANKLGISINTVKAQMKNALARLRELLKDYLNIILILIGI